MMGDETADDQRTQAGRVAVVTGGSRGIGLASAVALARQGASVAVVARRRPALDAALETLGAVEGAGPALGLEADTGDPEQSRAAMDRVLAEWGRIDVLVNNAATNPYFGPLTGLDAERATRTFSVNQLGPLLWTQLAWEGWMEANGGSVVNVTSLGADIVNRGIGFYNATKAALNHLTRHLASELAPRVRVNGVAPGLVKTDMARALWETKEAELASSYPLQRLGEPSDIGAAVAFLAGPEASWITGQTLVVDGGASVIPAEQMVGGW